MENDFRDARAILKILLSSELTPSGIAEHVGACHANVARHLEVLEAEGLIQHVMFGRRIRYYKFNETSSKAIAVRSLIEIFENARAEDFTEVKHYKLR